MSATYSNVDASIDPVAAVTSQELVDSWPQVQAYKQRTYDLLAQCESVLDVGCGPGIDISIMGNDRVIGVDTSSVMVAAAARREGGVCRGDGRRLPFRDQAFGGVRADRVVQHVAEPVTLVQEMIRVCRSGGQVVVADPDQETLTINVPGVPQRFTDELKRLRRDAGYASGRYVSALPATLVHLGLADVSVDAFPVVLTDPSSAFGLPKWPRLWQSRGNFSDDEIAGWEQTIRSAPIVYALLYFVVSGKKK